MLVICHARTAHILAFVVTDLTSDPSKKGPKEKITENEASINTCATSAYSALAHRCSCGCLPHL